MCTLVLLMVYEYSSLIALLLFSVQIHIMINIHLLFIHSLLPIVHLHALQQSILFLRHEQRNVQHPVAHWHEMSSLQLFGIGSSVISIGTRSPLSSFQPDEVGSGSIMAFSHACSHTFAW